MTIETTRNITGKTMIKRNSDRNPQAMTAKMLKIRAMSKYVLMLDSFPAFGSDKPRTLD